MGGPAGLSVMAAAVALAVAAYSALSLAVPGPGGRRLRSDVNFSHVLMGAAMAGMALSRLNVLPTLAWEAVFGAEAVWFASAMARSGRVGDGCPRDGDRDRDRADRSCHCATHTVMAVCMLYMYLGRGVGAPGRGGMAMAGDAGPAALPAGHGAWLPLVFVAVLVVSAACEMSPVLPLPRAAGLSPTSLPAPPPAQAAPPTALSALAAAAPRRLTYRWDAAAHVAMCLVMGYMLVAMG